MALFAGALEARAVSDVKETIHIDAAIVADIAKTVAAEASSHVTDPRAAAMLAPLLELLKTSGVEVLRAASTMEFELHWPPGIPVDARQTMQAQLKDEMRSQAMRTLKAQGKAMVEFQVRCASAVLNSITDRMNGAITKMGSRPAVRGRARR